MHNHQSKVEEVTYRDKKGRFVKGRIYKHSEETKRKIGLGNKGKILSDETKRKIGEKSKGREGWSKGLTKETDERLRKSAFNMKGKIFSREHKINISRAKRGKPGYSKYKINEQEVIDLYSDKKMKVVEIASILHCSTNKIYKVLEKNKVNTSKKGIPNPLRRELNLLNNPMKRPEVIEKQRKTQKGLFAGEKNPMFGIHNFGDKSPRWLGGLSFEPYTKEFNDAFKESIRIRDGFLCLKCGMREEDSLILLKRKLVVHHINYDKKLTIKENCCALCHRCNIEVNINRLQWTKFFQSILSERYGYKYSEKGEVILDLENENSN